MIFDIYPVEPTIKGYEHSLRDTIGELFQITGPNQKRKKAFLKDLKNINFKKAFVEFLISDWGNPEMIAEFNKKNGRMK